ncbi:MAG: DEAD/DEAH box helicase [Proteobacteria bacterium]|nr:DEAD/DEAH box helicase [Pseudomonadota bacterium]
MSTNSPQSTILSFSDLGVEQDLLAALKLLEFETPTEIQALAVPQILKSEQDLIALAQTGTGKTAGFALPCIQKLSAEHLHSQLLILSPTRELALQTARAIKQFCKKKKGIKAVALYGGADISTQKRALKKGAQIVVGTPGRTLDFIKRGDLQLEKIAMVVLDEADEMLKMGFQEDLEAILEQTPKEKQTLLFSATMPRSVERIALRYLIDPHRIFTAQRNVGAVDVEHIYYLVHPDDRYAALKRLVDANPNMYGIIFCRTRLETTDIVVQLRKDGYIVDVLNGDLSQKQRDWVMRQFRSKELQLLVATDVAARGLDVNNLTHVINFNMPDELEVYVHRSGRTGRAGQKGTALSLMSKREHNKLKALKKMVKQPFNQHQIPTGPEIYQAQLTAMLNKLDSTSASEEILQQYDDLIDEKLKQYDSRELIQRLLNLLCGTMLKTYQNAPDLNKNSRSQKRSKDDRSKRRRSRETSGKKESSRNKTFKGKTTTCKINVGKEHGINPHRLMGLVNECFTGPKPHFGKISIQKNNTVFELDAQAVSTTVNAIRSKKFSGQQLNIKIIDKK